MISANLSSCQVSSSPRLSLVRGTLLIVDDENGPRVSLTVAFRDHYNVITASGGKEAIGLTSTNAVDVVLCDVRMPDMSGTDVLRELKQMDPRIEVIMLTAYESLETARAAVTYGAAEYISKPFDLAQVRQAVARCFEKRQGALELQSSLHGLAEANKALEARLREKEEKASESDFAPVVVGEANHSSPAPAPAAFVHWREYGQRLLERKWVAITAFVVVVTLALIWTFKATPIYCASTRLQVDAETIKVLNIQDVVTADTRDAQYMNTQIKILQSRTLAEQAARSLALNQNPAFLPGATPGTDYAAALQGCITIQAVQGTRLIDILADHPDPKVAALLANGVANEFIKQNVERKLSASLEAVRWLREQAAEHRQKVEKSEAVLQEYREKTYTVSFEDRQNIVVEKLKDLNSAVTGAKTGRLGAESEWNELKARLDADQEPGMIPAITANPLVSALGQQLANKEIAVSILRKRYKDKHPAMISAMTELSEIKQKWNKACLEAAESIKANYLMAKAKEESLQRALKEQEQEALDLSRNLIQYTMLKRNADGDQQLYEAILTRMKEAGVTDQLDTHHIQVVDPARPPSSPYKPRKTRDILLACLLGAVLGVGFSFAAHFYDDKVKTHDDIESYLDLPLLSSIPTIKRTDRLEKARVSHLEPRSLASEAFLTLRASIGLNPNARAARSILVTSTAPAEGKSFVAANLAIVFAHNQQRTLLIDADMRHPVQHEVFHVDQKQSLRVFLTDSTSLEGIIHPTDIPNLDVIAAGQVPPNPSELLGSLRMRQLLAEASRKYDRIVIDSPPISAVSDPLILLPSVQGIVFVIHFSKVRRDIVARAVQKLREGRVPVLGAVLNNVDLEKHGYYYYPYRYSHYYRKEDVDVEAPAQATERRI